MKTIIALLILTMFVLPGCVTSQKACCPHKDAVFFVNTPIGPMPVIIEKDYFSKDNEGKSWIGSDEYNKMMEEPLKEELKKQSDEAAKETDEELRMDKILFMLKQL